MQIVWAYPSSKQRVELRFFTCCPAPPLSIKYIDVHQPVEFSNTNFITFLHKERIQYDLQFGHSQKLIVTVNLLSYSATQKSMILSTQLINFF